MIRKAPTLSEKLAAILPRHVCSWCGRVLGSAPVEWDHAEYHCFGGDSTSLDPLHKDCHRAKTSGVKHIPLSGDISKIAKVKRLSRKQEEFRTRLLTKAEGVEIVKGGRRWPSRRLR